METTIMGFGLGVSPSAHRRSRRDSCLETLGIGDLGFRDLGFRDLGFRDLGFKGLGFLDEL